MSSLSSSDLNLEAGKRHGGLTLRLEGLPLISMVAAEVALVITAWGRGTAVLTTPVVSSRGRALTVLAASLVPVHMVPVAETGKKMEHLVTRVMHYIFTHGP